MKTLRRIWRHMPVAVKTPVNIKRLKRHWLKAGAIFVHVPKAAGTSVSHALYGRHLLHFTARTIREYAPAEFDSLFTFSLVRNPYAKLLSAYRFACVGHTGDMGVSNPEQYRIPEFESFDRFVTEWLVHQKLWEVDQIFWPQSVFVCDNHDGSGEIIVDHVGKVEQIEASQQKISTVLGREISFQRLNTTSSNSAGYREEYHNSQVRNIVTNLYAQDLERFDYEF